MKSYGKFEAVRELYQTPVAAIWTARPVGTQGAEGACIKLIQPDSAVFAGKGAAAAEEMLIAAALQQSIANKSEHWAPVYELGYDGKTAFYASKLFDRSIQRLIDSRTKVSSADLLTITAAIVEGLLDLESAFNRNHGNLKPANVLIAGRGKIRREDIRLTDPNAGDQEAPSVTRSPDAKAIGEIIFGLVTGRPHTAARWPVPESDEWDRLGASGLQWLDLCNDLLNTMARQGPMRLAKIQARLSVMRPGGRRMSRKWLLVPVLIAAIGCGYAFREQLLPKVMAAKTWAISLTHAKTRTTPYEPSTEPVPYLPTSRPVFAMNPPAVVRPVPTPQPPIQVATVVEPVAPVPPPVEVVKPAPVPIPDPPALPVVQLPAFLPGTAAAKFLDTVSHLSTPGTAGARARFVDSVNPLDAQYPVSSIKGDRPWQGELSKLVDARREAELTLAVAALADSQTPDPSKYHKYAADAQAFNTDAADAEDTINSGASWIPEANQAKLHKARQDELTLLDDPKNRNAAPPVLEEMQAINDAVAGADPRALLVILHDQSSSLPARVAAWQALDLPAMHGRWPASRADFVAGQKDGDALISAAAGTNLNPKSAISDFQDRRLNAFYSSLSTEPAVTDAVTHLDEIEAGRSDQRPRWLEFDRVLYSLTIHATSPSDADLKQLKALTGIPEAAGLYAALDKARNAALNEQPLKGIGPGLLNWAARPFNVSGIDGCVYSNPNCPPIEFIRVEPGAGKGLPFYLSTTEVPVGLISALLADSTQTSPAATDALKALCPAPPSPVPGARVWKFAAGSGIELDPESYLQYFRQSPTPDLPMQQITPQAALYFARDLGCRLPTSAEWKSAFETASNPTTPNDPMKGFATVGWKLRDGDFTALVGKAAVSQHFPDDGIFLGPDPSLIPTGSSATTWTPASVHKLGGWTVTDLQTDPQAQRQMAKLDESSSDFRADLVDAPQMGFRPVGTTHHVFHDLVGNVGEIVLDAPSSDMEMLPWGTKITEREISDWFAAGNRLRLSGVIGGSFLSPPELDPTARVPFPEGNPHPAFADVGFRLVFTDPKVFADASSVIKHTGYLYPPPPPKPADSAP